MTKFDFIAQYDIKKLEHKCISCISAIWTKHKARQIRQVRKTAVYLWWCLTDFLAKRKQEVHSDNFQALPVIQFFSCGSNDLNFHDWWENIIWIWSENSLWMLPITAALRNTWQMSGQWSYSLHLQYTRWDINLGQQETEYYVECVCACHFLVKLPNII